MKTTRPVNLPASVRERLLNLSRSRREDFQLTLTRYGIECLLVRLSQSLYSHRFVLKGAQLFNLWTASFHRPTRDLDLAGYGDSSQQALAQLFRELCSLDAEPDGLTFHPDSVRVTEIRGGQEYGGQRVQMLATLDNARIDLRVDIGFGDAVTPGVEEVEYPTLLGSPAPRLRAYPKETVVAEKLHAAVVLGVLNSRMKDYYDVWAMSRELRFDGPVLTSAIRATFKRRLTEIPRVIPVALTSDLAQRPDKIVQWNAFLSRSGLRTGGKGFPEIVEDLSHFLMPPLEALAGEEDFCQVWPAGGSWIPA